MNNAQQRKAEHIIVLDVAHGYYIAQILEESVSLLRLRLLKRSKRAVEVSHPVQMQWL